MTTAVPPSPPPADPPVSADELRRLEQELLSLRARLQEYEKRDAVVATVGGKARAWGWLFLAGRELDVAVAAVFRRLYARQIPTEEEAAHLIGGVFRRLVRVGIIGFLLPLAVALIPNLLLYWQTRLVAQQNEYLRAQNEFLILQTEEHIIEEEVRGLERIATLEVEATKLASAMDNLAKYQNPMRPDYWTTVANAYDQFMRDVHNAIASATIPADVTKSLSARYAELPALIQFEHAPDPEGQRLALTAAKLLRDLAAFLRQRRVEQIEEHRESVARLGELLTTPSLKRRVEKLAADVAPVTS